MIATDKVSDHFASTALLGELAPIADGSQHKPQRQRPRPDSPSFLDHMRGSTVLFSNCQDEVAQATHMSKRHGGLKFAGHRNDDHFLRSTGVQVGHSSISQLAMGGTMIDEVAQATGMSVRHGGLKYADHMNDDHMKEGVASLIGGASISQLAVDRRDEIAVATGMHTEHGGLAGAAHREDDHFMGTVAANIGQGGFSNLAVDNRDEIAVATHMSLRHGGERYMGQVGQENARGVIGPGGLGPGAVSCEDAHVVQTGRY